MAGDTKTMLKEAVQAFQKGDRQKAQQLLLDIVSADEQNEKAWLLLSAVVTTLEDREVALENVLTINPSNDKARKGLELVRAKLAERKPRGPVGGAGWSGIDTDEITQVETTPAWEAVDDPWDEESSWGETEPSWDDIEDPTPQGRVPKGPPVTTDVNWDAPAAENLDTASTSVDWETTAEAAPASFETGEQVNTPGKDNITDDSSFGKSTGKTPISSGSEWGNIDTSALFGSGDPDPAPEAVVEEKPAGDWGSWGSWDDEPANSVDSGAGGWGTETPVVDDTPQQTPAFSGWGSDEDPFADADWATEKPDVDKTPSVSDEVNGWDDDPFGDDDWGTETPVAAETLSVSDEVSDRDDDEDPFDDDWGSETPAVEEASTGFSSVSGWDDEDDPFADSPWGKEPPKPKQTAGIKKAPESSGSGWGDDPFGEASWSTVASSTPAPQPAPTPVPVQPQTSAVGGWDDDEDPFDDWDDEPAGSGVGVSSGYELSSNPFEVDEDPFDAVKRSVAGDAARQHPSHEYFKLIPTEIEAPAKRMSAQAGLKAGVGILGVLNLAALISLLMQLM